MFRNVGLAAAVLGTGAFLAMTVAGCGTTEAEATVQPKLPTLDLEAPAQFQTATFAYG